MTKLNLQFTDEPTAAELNSSEQHVQAIMNTKISDATTYISYSDDGKLEVTLPSSTPERRDWREELGKDAKILDACLQSDTITVSSLLCICLRSSRHSFDRELCKQRSVLDGCSVAVNKTPGLFPSCRSLKSRNFLQPMKRAFFLKSRQISPMLEWKTHMLAFLLSKNQEIEQSMKDFISEVTARKDAPQPLKERIDKEEEYVTKSQRARNYEKYGAVSPLANTSRLKIAGRTQCRILRDVVGTFFSAGARLDRRIKIIHSIRLIQQTYRLHLVQRKLAATLTIQTWFRAHLTEQRFLHFKFCRFRVAYFQAKLAHWYPLMVNKYKERRAKRLRKSDFACFSPHIITIQKHIRGFIVRKHRIPWVKEVSRLRLIRRNRAWQCVKLRIWGKSRGLEEDLLKTATAVEEQITNSQIMAKQGRRVKGFESEKEMMEYFSSLEKAEMACRKQKMWLCTSLRQKIIVQ